MRLVILRLVVIALALAGYLLRLPSWWVETIYTRRLYGWFQPLLTGATNRVPFALFDVLLVAVLVLVTVAIVRAVHRALRGRPVRETARLVLNVLATSALIYLGFLGLWGLNYQREPLTSHLDFNRSAVSHEQVLRLARQTVDELNQLHDRAHQEGFPTWDRLRPAMDGAFRRVQDALVPGLAPRSGVPKWTLLSYFFDRAGVSGMTNPFLLEVLIDRELLPFERPFVLAHEWAHLAGYADEAEANFIGWVTCMNGKAPIAYSGWLYLYSQALGSLPREDRTALVRALGAGPRADLVAEAERARRIHPVLQSVSWRVYDRYLKANRVGEGVASYDRALVLVLGARFVNGWMPAVKKMPAIN